MRRADRDESGQATIIIVGFAFVLAVAIAMVVDASSAYLQRQGLDTVADGAALQGADLGATGLEVYTRGVPAQRLDLSVGEVRAAVRDYLTTSGAYADYPGLSFSVDVDQAASRVTVRVRAPLDLPLLVPGSPEVAMISATGAAAVFTERG
jgi:hypothetical protein